MNKVYYIYEHVRLDTNQVFYVGIGTNIINNKNQNHYKRSKSKYKRSVLWNNIVKKTDYKINIVFETSILKEAFDKEIELIKKYGRIIYNSGSLANISDGGEGNFGFKPTLEQIERLRQYNIGRKDTKETLHNKSISQKGKFVPKKVGEKISISKKGKPLKVKISSENKRIRKISTGEVFKSISEASRIFNYRRNTFGKMIKSNLLEDFELISDDLYFTVMRKRNWKKEKYLKNARNSGKREL